MTNERVLKDGDGDAIFDIVCRYVESPGDATRATISLFGLMEATAANARREGSDEVRERVEKVRVTLGSMPPADESEAEVQSAYDIALRAALDVSQ